MRMTLLLFSCTCWDFYEWSQALVCSLKMSWIQSEIEINIDCLRWIYMWYVLPWNISRNVTVLVYILSDWLFYYQFLPWKVKLYNVRWYCKLLFDLLWICIMIFLFVLKHILWYGKIYFDCLIMFRVIVIRIMHIFFYINLSIIHLFPNQLTIKSCHSY